MGEKDYPPHQFCISKVSNKTKVCNEINHMLTSSSHLCSPRIIPYLHHILRHEIQLALLNIKTMAWYLNYTVYFEKYLLTAWGRKKLGWEVNASHKFAIQIMNHLCSLTKVVSIFSVKKHAYNLLRTRRLQEIFNKMLSFHFSWWYWL